MTMQNQGAAWPFTQPVNRDEVLDYYEVLMKPTDLSTMEKTTRGTCLFTPKDFITNAMLILSILLADNSYGKWLHGQNNAGRGFPLPFKHGISSFLLMMPVYICSSSIDRLSSCAASFSRVVMRRRFESFRSI
jgi:hypothetical protein